jgi:hypothetical protein
LLVLKTATKHLVEIHLRHLILPQRPVGRVMLFHAQIAQRLKTVRVMDGHGNRKLPQQTMHHSCKGAMRFDFGAIWQVMTIGTRSLLLEWMHKTPVIFGLLIIGAAILPNIGYPKLLVILCPLIILMFSGSPTQIG